eukprot:6443722-Pyramimonas_sp.AAC.1
MRPIGGPGGPLLRMPYVRVRRLRARARRRGGRMPPVPPDGRRAHHHQLRVHAHGAHRPGLVLG